MSDEHEQAADVKECHHDWLPNPLEGGFYCTICGAVGFDQREPLECPACGEQPKIEQQYVVRCGNYSSCKMRPRVTAADKLLAISAWNQRAGKDANRWAIYGVDKETGEVKDGQ